MSRPNSRLVRVESGWYRITGDNRLLLFVDVMSDQIRCRSMLVIVLKGVVIRIDSLTSFRGVEVVAGQKSLKSKHIAHNVYYVK